MATRSSCRNVLPKGNEKRCRNSAETSRAISIRVAELSDLYVGQTDAAGVSASIAGSAILADTSHGIYRTIFRCPIPRDAVDREAYHQFAVPTYWSRNRHPVRQLPLAMTMALA